MRENKGKRERKDNIEKLTYIKEVDMGPVTKQDVQNLIDVTRNRIFERMDRLVHKQDVQTLQDCVKNLVNLHQQNQQLLRQADDQRLQLIRRMTALEARLAQIERQMLSSKGELSKVAQAASQPRQMIFAGQTAPNERFVESNLMNQHVYTYEQLP